MIDKAQLDKLCHLAKLAPAKDANALQAQLDKILHLFDAIDAIETSELEPLAHPTDAIFQPMREDTVSENDQHLLFQTLAPATAAALYLVPPVIDDTSEA